jgi:anti-anti-sigma factor
MDTRLRIQVRHEEGMSIATIGGEARFEIEALEIELGRLAELHPAVVILDMTDLVVLSSLGMGLIVSLRNALKNHGGRLLACGVRPGVMDAFQRARLEKIFEVYETLEEAMASAKEARAQNV